MYKILSDSVLTPLFVSVVIIIAFNIQLMVCGADRLDPCSHLLQNISNNNIHMKHVMNTTNKNSQTTTELYKEYTNCVKTRYDKQHRNVRPTDSIADNLIERHRRSVLEGEGMRFKKDPILDEEGMRFKKDTLLDDEGMRFKKSVLEGEGMRFRKNDRMLDEEGMRFRKKSVLDGEGMRFKKASILDDEGMRFKKASILDDEGMRFKKSVLDGEGMRFKKDNLLDEEGMRFKKASILDDEGMRFKKSVLDGEGMRFRKSVLDGEGMRFKKLMANQLSRLRKYKYVPLDDMDERRDQDGGTSSDILEGEGMRFKRAHFNGDGGDTDNGGGGTDTYYMSSPSHNKHRYVKHRLHSDNDYRSYYNLLNRRVKPIYILYRRK